MNINKQNITEKIYLLTFDSQLDLTSSFLRFQEFYESPEFKNKIFSLTEFKEWYIQNSKNGRKTNTFTYYSDWNGFNIPSNILTPFYEGKFNPLSKREKKILEIFENEPEPFYIIGVHKFATKLDEYLEHEIAHGLFFTDKNYKTKILKILSKFEIELIKEELRSKSGYHEDVLIDEVHAYSINSGGNLQSQIPPELIEKIRKIYNEHLKINNVQIKK